MLVRPNRPRLGRPVSEGRAPSHLAELMAQLRLLRDEMRLEMVGRHRHVNRVPLSTGVQQDRAKLARVCTSQ
jgi:hypothetical protein